MEPKVNNRMSSSDDFPEFETGTVLNGSEQDQGLWDTEWDASVDLNDPFTQQLKLHLSKESGGADKQQPANLESSVKSVMNQ